MKNKAFAFLNQVFTVIVTMAKAKSTALKSRAKSMKTRLLVFRLLKNKKILMSAISRKIHALMGEDREKDSESSSKDDSRATVLLHSAEKDETLAAAPPLRLGNNEQVLEPPYEDDGYPDLRHSFLDDDDDDEVANGNGTVMDSVRNSREDGSRELRLEDEIDQVADLFIRRFHRQMKMEKLESFKRYQEMLQRGV